MNSPVDRVPKEGYDVEDIPSEEIIGECDYLSYIETGYETLQSPSSTKSISSLHCYFSRTEEEFIEVKGYVFEDIEVVEAGVPKIIRAATAVDRTEFDKPSSCIFTSKWEWTNTGNANRWSPPQQGYRFRAPYVAGEAGSLFDYDYDVIVSRNKVLGKGRALSIRFESESGKDFRLLGWTAEYSVGSKV